MSIKRLADGLGRMWGVLPERWRTGVLFGLFVLEGRSGEPAEGLRCLFAAEDRLRLAINERAMAYGGGEHPKHRLTRYHDFFIERIAADERVLDIGCGYGAVARSIAAARPAAAVLGIDLDDGRLAQARAADNPANLSFGRADATRSLPPGPWTTVVLSNVLEHVDDRPGFLRAVVAAAVPRSILVRVPLFERDWSIALRAELGVDYRSDPDHRIEHRLTEFRTEVAAAGLAIVELQTLWGEIWAACRPAA